MLKNLLTKRNLLLLSSVLLSLIGLILYIVVSTTGYFVGDAPNAYVILGTILFAVITIAFIFLEDKIEKYDSIVFFVLAALFVLAFVFFVLDKEEVVGEMLIPVNHPQKQIDAATTSIVGIAFYLVSFVLFTVASFLGKGKVKEAKAA